MRFEYASSALAAAAARVSNAQALTQTVAFNVLDATATLPTPLAVADSLVLNALVTSDAFLGTLGGFVTSSFASVITPGTYRLLATDSGIRDSVLDASLSFVPEPETYLLMLAGIGVAGFMARRRAD